jgi:hypothetical protein
MKKIASVLVGLGMMAGTVVVATPANAAKGPEQVGPVEVLNIFWKESYDKKDRKVYCNTVRISKMNDMFVTYPGYKINRTVESFHDMVLDDYGYIRYALNEKYDGFYEMTLPTERQSQAFTNKECKKIK